MFRIVPIKGGISAVDGFYTSGVKAGLKKDGYDVGYIYSETMCDVAYTFTTNRFQASPLKHTLQNGIKETNFLLLNSKNANAMTGEEGIKDVEELLDF
jgi:glutamate N-acetyltransferase/amino-acid N-acetyltransferase